MRLLELRHSEHGRPPSSLRDATSRLRSESLEAVPDAAIEDAPRLRVTIAAAPQGGVIAGAIVGVAIDVFNDGTAPAPETTLLLSLPHDAEFRTGSLRIDGREPNAPEGLFRSGLAVARLPGQSSLKVTFQLQVLAGIGALYLQPRLSAVGVPVVGTPGISIKRASGPVPAPTREPERPFYELGADDDDIVVSDATDAILPPVVPPEPAPQPVPPPKLVVFEPPLIVSGGPVAPGATIAEARVPAKVVRHVAAPVEERMTCVRSIAAADVALLDRMFSLPVPGFVAHAMLISTLACDETSDGPISDELSAFLARDVAALGRLLVLARMGKPLRFAVDQPTLDGLRIGWRSDGTLPAGKRTPRCLRRELRPPEYAALTGLMQPSERDPNLRVRIALLALAGAAIDGVDANLARESAAALGIYRAATLAWLVPLCVASAQAPPAYAPPPAALDLAGRRVVRALGAVFAA